MKKTSIIDLLVIAFLWSTSIVITNPLGDFPLNDDWSFGQSVRHFLERGEFRPTGWTAMSLATNVLWGALYCIPGGFSFNALRFSTLTMSLLGGFAIYILMIELRRRRWLAVLTSLTLIFSPIYYALSHTFMTDVPFTALSVIACIFFVRHIKTGSAVDLIFGTIISIAATMSRQVAIAVPLAFAVTAIVRKGIKKQDIVRGAIPSICCVGILVIFQQWLKATGCLPEDYSAKSGAFFSSFLSPGTIVTLGVHSLIVLPYLGWFLLPVLITIFRNAPGSPKIKFRILLIALSAMLIGKGALTLKWGMSSFLLPNHLNIITASGIGPFTLHDACLHCAKLPTLPDAFWIVITAMGFLGAVLLLAVIGLSLINYAQNIRSAAADRNEIAGAFVLMSAAIYLLPVLSNQFFDRYLIPVIPLLAAGIAAVPVSFCRTGSPVRHLAAGASLLTLMAFAVLGTKDYLSWNRVRWEALHALMKDQQVKVEDIDGGIEFNGWYLYDPRQKIDDFSKVWWWVKGDTYRIDFGSTPGYAVVREYRYFRWLPPGRGKIVVLKKNSPRR